jgi:DNA transformation protein
MPVQQQFRDYVLEQLSGLRDVHANRMFGGVGLYSGGLFFGLIDDDTVFFKTDASNIEQYRVRNMPRFMPFPDRPEAILGYHQVPADVLEDAETLVSWARQSVLVAASARASKGGKGKQNARKTGRKTGRKTKTRNTKAAKTKARKTKRSATQAGTRRRRAPRPRAS